VTRCQGEHLSTLSTLGSSSSSRRDNEITSQDKQKSSLHSCLLRIHRIYNVKFGNISNSSKGRVKQRQNCYIIASPNTSS
jgi:hypothetical protein